MGNSARKHALELDNRDISTLYDRGEELGSGKFATTYAATRRADSLPVAIKVLRKCHHKFKRGKALDEIEAMVCLGDGHPNCVQLIAAFEDGQTISVVEEIVPGGELLDRISGSQSFSERHAAGIIHQVLSGVAYLHSVGITHRDIKPANILFVSRDPESPDYDRVKICDYGLAHSSKHGSLRSRVAGANPMSTMCGSPLYMAPEIARSIIKCRLSEEQEPEEYTNLVDVWSCGVLLYVMVCGFQPFTEWIDLVKCDLSFDYPEFNNVSDSAKGFIASLLTDADDRMSASSALQDPWLQEAGGDAAASWSPLASTHTLKQTKGILGIRSRLTRVFSPVLRASSRHRKGEVSPFSSSSFLSPHDSQTASARSSPQGSGRRSFADFLSRSSTPSRSRSKFAVTSPQGKSRTWQGADESQPGPLTRMGLFKGARSVDSHSQGVMAKAAADHTLRPVSPLPGGGRETMVPRTKPMSMNISPLRSQFVRSISPLAVRRRKAAAEASPATASTASPAASPFLALSPVAATDSLTPVPLE